MAFKIGWNDGHTLSGTGTGAAKIIKETDRNRAIGKLAKKYLLEYEGVEIVDCTIDRSENDMKDAVAKANNANCDLFVSNHVNAGGGKGFETFYSRKSTASNIEKAKIIHAELCATKSCLANRRCCDDYSYKGYDLYVLINTKMDAILCEIGFVDNQSCVNAVNNDEVAKAYAAGIAKAYGLKKKAATSTNINAPSSVSEFKDGCQVKVLSNAIYGGLSTARGTKVPSSVIGNTYTATKFAINAGSHEGLLAGINSWIPVNYLQVVSNATYHTVVKGDTLYSISKKYSTTVAKIQSLNGMGSSTTLTIGKRLRVK